MIVRVIDGVVKDGTKTYKIGEEINLPEAHGQALIDAGVAEEVITEHLGYPKDPPAPDGKKSPQAPDTTGLNVAQMSERIAACETVEDVNALIKDEQRKGVLDAAAKQIKALEESK